MSNADRLRSGLGLRMSDRLMNKGPVGRRAPITSPHPSLAHPCQWIRRHTRRYTLQGATFTNLNSIYMKDAAPPASQPHRVILSILRHPYGSDRLQKIPPHGVGAAPRAPPSVRTSTPDSCRKQTQVPSGLVVCRQHTLTTSTPHSTHTHTTCSLYITPHHYSTFDRSRITEHVLLRDRPAHAPTADPNNPRSYQAGDPLALLNVVPQPPHPPKTWTRLWNPLMSKDSIRLLSSPPVGQPLTWDGPLTHQLAQMTRTGAIVPPRPTIRTTLAPCVPSR
jgi:hypothetical protein